MKNGELCIPNRETELPEHEINFPRLGENKGKQKFSQKFDLCETGGGNEREFRFRDKFQLHRTVPISQQQVKKHMFVIGKKIHSGKASKLK